MRSISSWPEVSVLFPALNKLDGFADFPELLDKVWPLSAKHRRSLPADIDELSRLLTCERGGLRGSYWRKPAYVSAYLHYFLPWNVIRLAKLFTALELPQPTGLSRPLFMDIGSGPLTVPIALLLVKPELRRLPIHVVALDGARQPLELGAALLTELGARLGGFAWQIATVADSLASAGRHAPPNCQPWLITAANVLNELKPRRHNRDLSQGRDENRFVDLLGAWRPLWSNGLSALCFAEPGTRLGGGAIMRLRGAAIELGLMPQSPCPHDKGCPLLAKPGAWCHFVFSAQDAPQWLKAVSREAGFYKTSLSLSPLLLGPGNPTNAFRQDSLPVRVISQAFTAAGVKSRYGCAACGLSLLQDSPKLVSGSLTLAAVPRHGKRDGKSGAIILEPYC